MTLPRPAIPNPTLRVGVIGKRRILPEHLPHTSAATAAALAFIAAEARRHAPGIQLTLLSSLAEGADQIAAEEARPLLYQLHCPLPFDPTAYAATMSTEPGRDRYRALLTQATSILTLDGEPHPEDERNRAYEAAARFIVRNTDVIIAVWDGHGGSRGGTADTIRYAASFGPPILWVHATDPHAPLAWIEEAHDLRWKPYDPLTGGTLPPGRSAETLLPLYLERLLVPPHPPHPQHHSRIHHAMHRLWHRIDHARGHPAHPPMQQFFDEDPLRPYWVWQSHNALVALATGRPKPMPKPPEGAAWFERDRPALIRALRLTWQHLSGNPPPPWTPPPPNDPDALVWHAHHVVPDARANEFSLRYRSSYVWAFLLGALSLAAAPFALAYPEDLGFKLAASTFEFVALLLILGLVVLDGKAGWQRKSIEYRMLGELCRKQQALAPFGWAVPRAGAWCTTLPPQKPGENMPHADDTTWVSWLFTAMLRAAPMTHGVMIPARVAEAKAALLDGLIRDQAAYHRKTCIKYHRAARNLIRAGELLFLAVTALVAVKLLILNTHFAHSGHGHDWLRWLGLAAAILPAIAAALFGVRAYGEMEMMAEQSKAMMLAMEHAAGRVEQLDPRSPLASQVLGSAAAGVVTLMLQDLEGWARVFRGKVVET